jgi:hypothetical protein
LRSAKVERGDGPPTASKDAQQIREALENADAGKLTPGNAAKIIDCETGDRRYKAAVDYGIAEGLFIKPGDRKPLALPVELPRADEPTEPTGPTF